MPYKFATQDQDYSDFAGGRVLYSLPGLPAFPVRLAVEIFLRARAFMQSAPEKKLNLYDPTCGGAYHLAALGFLHGKTIGTILASDVDPRALELAQRNLGLLSTQGLDRREQEIRHLLDQYGKESHAEALSSAAVLRGHLDGVPPIRTRVFQANALDRNAIQTALAGERIHLVISDIPYGQLSAWRLPDEITLPEESPSIPHSPVWRLLDALLPVLAEDSFVADSSIVADRSIVADSCIVADRTIVAIAADKAQKIAHAGYRRVERFQIGKRQVSFLSPLRVL